MDKPDREAEPHFSQPWNQILLMLVVLGLVGFGAWLALPVLYPVFAANPWLNGVIMGVFVIGVLACFGQLYQLVTSISWIKRVTRLRAESDLRSPPRLMAPLAALLRMRGDRMQIDATSARSILDSVGMRIDELREITRYITNLLIFLGLLGTFYGLATTVPALVDTIRSLAPQEGEGGVEVFTRLMAGLETQLGGMGTAFSSSLLGLAGSLVVGLLEIFAGHGQNRFYRELEEWLSSITRFGFTHGDAAMPAGAGGTPGAMGAIMPAVDAGIGAAPAEALALVAQHMGALQEQLARSEAERGALAERLDALTASLESLAGRIGREADTGARLAQLLEQLGQGQAGLLEQLSKLQEESAHVDAESRMRLRSIDVQLLRILEEISAGRQESMIELRGDIAGLTRAIRHLATGDPDHGDHLLPGSEG